MGRPSALRGLPSLALVLALAGGGPASSSGPSDYADWVAEAASRFSVPQAWIWAVMERESGFRARAISPGAGAIGLMQVMPNTYAELRVRHGLGADPFDPRDNILAGTAYLREMHDRYGAPGFLAAYNAGPGRYEAFLGGRPLPPETREYLAALTPLLFAATPARGGLEVHPASPFVDPQLGRQLFLIQSASAQGPGR